jgi:histidinol dehydrogenase
VTDVAEILSDIRARGDDAVREWALRLDGVDPSQAVPEADRLPHEALLTLADRVRRWHEVQRPPDVGLEVAPGVELERRWVPIDSVGIYVPRGLISTLVMCAVPAQVAGVGRIVVATPPSGAGWSPRRPKRSASGPCRRWAGRRRSAGSRTWPGSTRSSGRGTRS